MAFPDGSEPCKEWLSQYQEAQTIGTIISVSLAIINGILRLVLRKSSLIEGHHTVTSQLGSSFFKMWVIQYVNTAIILLIMKNKLDSGLLYNVLKATGLNQFFFNGEYNEFPAPWYGVVGITIFTTCFINSITPIAAAGGWVVKLLLRWLDRKCTRDARKTRKILQEDYEKVYTGNEIEYDNRFSVLIAMIWVIFTFSAAMPTLYFAGFILCFTTYWTDKIMLLRFYRIPPRHGSDLVHKARGVIEVA